MLPRMPVRARLPSLWVERRRAWISAAGAERLLGLAEQQSEGSVDASEDPPIYYGSTYLVLSVAAVREAFAGRGVGEMTARDLARIVGDHPWVRLRIARLAREEAERRLGAVLAPGTARVTVEASTRSGAVMIEAAVEMPCGRIGEANAAVG